MDFLEIEACLRPLQNQAEWQPCDVQVYDLSLFPSRPNAVIGNLGHFLRNLVQQNVRDNKQE